MTGGVLVVVAVLAVLRFLATPLAQPGQPVSLVSLLSPVSPVSGQPGQSSLPLGSGTARLCYIRGVRITSHIAIVFIALTAVSCNKSVDTRVADAVRNFDNLKLSKKEVKVLYTQQIGDSAVAEVEVRSGLKLTLRNGRWEIDEVRIGDRRWEKLAHFQAALTEARRQDAASELQTVAAAVRLYLEQKGKVPEAADYRALISVLNPDYLKTLVFLDPWFTPYRYQALGATACELRSAGPDEQFGTADDLVERVAK
jgi:hypothetical protein